MAPGGKRPLAWIAGGIAVAGIAAVLLLARRPRTEAGPQPAAQRHPPLPTATFLPEFVATPAGPTNAMSEAQFQDEVSRRLALEVQKLKTRMQTRAEGSARKAAAASPEPAPAPAVPPSAPRAVEAAPTSIPVEPTAAPTVPVQAEAAPTAVPAPARPVTREGALVAIEDVDSPPRLARIVKPTYPPLALQAGVRGIVVLRILVSEQGTPLQVEVVRGVQAGLTESAVYAAKKWTFTPARKDGVAVRTWMVVPIPFEP